jgi:pyruvate dehydrogenase E1 component alpha subunit
VEAALDRAVEFASASEHPAPEEALEDVYAETCGGAVLR